MTRRGRGLDETGQAVIKRRLSSLVILLIILLPKLDSCGKGTGSTRGLALRVLFGA